MLPQWGKKGLPSKRVWEVWVSPDKKLAHWGYFPAVETSPAPHPPLWAPQVLPATRGTLPQGAGGAGGLYIDVRSD